MYVHWEDYKNVAWLNGKSKHKKGTPSHSKHYTHFSRRSCSWLALWQHRYCLQGCHGGVNAIQRPQEISWKAGEIVQRPQVYWPGDLLKRGKCSVECCSAAAGKRVVQRLRTGWETTWLAEDVQEDEVVQRAGLSTHGPRVGRGNIRKMAGNSVLNKVPNIL